MSEQSPVSEAVEAFYRYKAMGSENTAREYRRHVNKFRDWLADHTEETLFTAHAGHCEQFYAWMLDSDYAPSSVRVAHASLSAFYTTLKEQGGTRGFPDVEVTDPTDSATPERLDGMHGSSKKKVKGGDEPLTKDEVRQLIANVPQDKPVRNELIVRLLYQTGMRRSELVRVELDDIDTDERRIDVYGKKTDEYRKVWYQATLDDLLSVWIEADRKAVFYADESDYLFPSRVSERLSEQTVTDVVQQAAENAGLQETVYQSRDGQRVLRVGAHTLRKSFGVHFIKDGGDISYLMELLGHSSIEVTKESYLNHLDQDRRDAVREHGPAL